MLNTLFKKYSLSFFLEKIILYKHFLDYFRVKMCFFCLLVILVSVFIKKESLNRKMKRIKQQNVSGKNVKQMKEHEHLEV